mmetsp:Transcript_29230/g.84673  ORF Transcript_29230/g.84673 Transcript_29230/m.84673 type:complete len:448 (-) Transcript_29230:208-1551(-)
MASQKARSVGGGAASLEQVHGCRAGVRRWLRSGWTVVHVEQVHGGWRWRCCKAAGRLGPCSGLVVGLVDEAEQMQDLSGLLAALWHLLALEEKLRGELRHMPDDAVQSMVGEGLNGIQGLQPRLPALVAAGAEFFSQLLADGIRIKGLALADKFLERLCGRRHAGAAGGTKLADDTRLVFAGTGAGGGPRRDAPATTIASSAALIAPLSLHPAAEATGVAPAWARRTIGPASAAAATEARGLIRAGAVLRLRSGRRHRRRDAWDLASHFGHRRKRRGHCRLEVRFLRLLRRVVKVRVAEPNHGPSASRRPAVAHAVAAETGASARKRAAAIAATASSAMTFRTVTAETLHFPAGLGGEAIRVCRRVGAEYRLDGDIRLFSDRFVGRIAFQRVRGAPVLQASLDQLRLLRDGAAEVRLALLANMLYYPQHLELDMGIVPLELFEEVVR